MRKRASTSNEQTGQVEMASKGGSPVGQGGSHRLLPPVVLRVQQLAGSIRPWLALHPLPIQLLHPCVGLRRRSTVAAAAGVAAAFSIKQFQLLNELRRGLASGRLDLATAVQAPCTAQRRQQQRQQQQQQAVSRRCQGNNASTLRAARPRCNAEPAADRRQLHAYKAHMYSSTSSSTHLMGRPSPPRNRTRSAPA